MTTVYATITDSNYLVRAWALYRSLEPWLDGKVFSFYCVDDEAPRLLEKLRPANCRIIPHQAFETPELLGVRDQRARNEYCWTCKPAILQHAFATESGVDWAVYLDSDMLAFDDLDLALAQTGDAVAALTPHRFASPELAALAPVVGSYNAGYAAFRKTPMGEQALAWWLARCLEDCPNVPANGRFADQKYLDTLPSLFPTHVVAEPGMNTGPWNVDAATVNCRDGRVRMGEAPIQLYHFQGLRILGRRLFDLYPGAERITGPLLDHVYRPYGLALARAYGEIGRVQPGFGLGVRPYSLRQWLSQASRAVRGRSNLLRAAAPGCARS